MVISFMKILCFSSSFVCFIHGLFFLNVKFSLAKLLLFIYSFYEKKKPVAIVCLHGGNILQSVHK